MKQNLKEGLRPYLPENSIELVMDFIDGRNVHMRIARGRKSKLGDYRPPVKDRHHRISVNGDLQPCEFLITLTHEIAHMLTWERYGRKARPHGKAWKEEYSRMLAALLERKIFPPDIHLVIEEHVLNPKATSRFNTDLVKVLHSGNTLQEGIFLEDLPAGTSFSLPNGRRFIKMDKLRKWYRCKSLDNKRMYRVSPVARVFPMEDI
jgi:hypothetical protein